MTDLQTIHADSVSRFGYIATLSHQLGLEICANHKGVAWIATKPGVTPGQRPATALEHAYTPVNLSHHYEIRRPVPFPPPFSFHTLNV
ncbi:hypothetical protein RSOLAG22IIIB_13684 [Rhizoctonia solani]|uniref:Uncharacterized protein n=1 Tax=Rhizoctonia solani TaxID=456999 RepID=A0A0K6FPY8_9AGAM|nr:hypothetical protein RSOLAG22IIIB_13684 [Rhizoctonia solani]